MRDSIEERPYNNGAMSTTMTINRPVTLTHHGAYKHLKGKADKLQEWMEKHWEWVRKQFKLPSEISVLLRPLPRRRTAGNHKKDGNGNHRVTIDVSPSLKSAIKTFFHELQHAEQSHTGRLRYEREGRGWVGFWDDQRWGRQRGFGRTQKEKERYDSQPWEVDANEKADEVMERFEKEVNEF